jgi:hypothetical protein
LTDVHPPVTGQWIWSRRDSALAESARRTIPDLRTAVWVATIAARGDSLTTSLGLPLAVAADDSAELAIRIDDSFSALWERFGDDTIAARLDVRIARILALADDTVSPRPVQLDYDCPSRFLSRYATVLGRVRRGALRSRRLWMTSLVAHVRDPSFGALFRPLVDGHIVQLFDTGDAFDDRQAAELPRLLNAQDLPFKLGVASFERRQARGSPTTHRAWFALIPRLSSSRQFLGVWVFPAGVPWLHLLPKS